MMFVGSLPLAMLLCALWLTMCEAGYAAVVSPDEMIVARRWVAAKFQGVQEVPPLEPGLTVSANYGACAEERPGRQAAAHRRCSLRTRPVLPREQQSDRAIVQARRRRFSAVIGVDTNDQTRPGRGSVVFSVEAGGKEVFRSGAVARRNAGRAGSRRFAAGHASSC